MYAVYVTTARYHANELPELFLSSERYMQSAGGEQSAACHYTSSVRNRDILPFLSTQQRLRFKVALNVTTSLTLETKLENTRRLRRSITRWCITAIVEARHSSVPCNLHFGLARCHAMRCVSLFPPSSSSRQLRVLPQTRILNV
jgi:hypothetical protein